MKRYILLTIACVLVCFSSVWAIPPGAPTGTGTGDFMKDGSVKATGTFDMDGNNISKVGTLGIGATSVVHSDATWTDTKWCRYTTAGGLECDQDAPYTNLTSFVEQTAWRVFYSDGSGDVKELALGSDGEYLKSNGASSAPSWATPTGAAHDALTLDATTHADDVFGLSTQVLTLDNQTANYVWAGPATGAAAAPTFRALVAADIPDISSTYLPKSVYDANTILYATTDNTPAALSVTEETVVGRVTSGAISALTLGVAAGNVMKAPADPAAHTLFGFDNTTNTYKNFTIGNGLSFTQATSTLAVGDLSGTYQPLDSTLTDIASKAITWSGNDVTFPGSITTTAADGSRKITLQNNTSATPTGSANEIYAEANIVKINQNGTESSAVIGPTAGQITITGPTQARSKAISDAADTIAELGQANTFTGTNTFNGATEIGDAGDDVNLNLNVNATDGHWSGVTITRTVKTGSAAEAFGQAMFINSSGELEAADSDVANAAAMPAVCLLVTAGEGASKKCVISGTVTETDWNWTIGGIIYVSDTPGTTGGMTQTRPATSGDFIQRVGIALSADTILVMPSLDVGTAP